ncbi:hypothetical protein XCR1_980080 [Xenorhabdus cabanillasii JM26]|uniref:Uncharacterized protein n=1 Tax=Xenorhabdus cabanillasii JM26 TaxID=1427517 RepID=W1JCY8_9GAMM|nr:hypothetical protein XCR1_980080 [Xenorhabdus cabanillasii JM26]
MPDPLQYAVRKYPYDHLSVKTIVFYKNTTYKTRNMFEINPVKNHIQNLSERTAVLRGYL